MLNDIGVLSRLMVTSCTFINIFTLKMDLTLPVATATTEKCFSAMKIVKTYLGSRMRYFFFEQVNYLLH